MKSNKILSREISLILELPQDADNITWLVKTCHSILWLCKHRQKG